MDRRPPPVPGEVRTDARSAAARPSGVPTDARDDAVVSVPCGLCGASNRVPVARLDDRPHCGSCGSALLRGGVGAIAASRLERALANCDLPVVVQATSERVPAERRHDAAFEALARELRGRALVYRVDVEREPALLEALGISAVPSAAVALRGNVVSRLSGGLGRAELGEWLLLHTLDALHGERVGA
ncbi:MAG: hypothetical protein R3F34_07035 [Planctomycetota bacterium]